MASGQSQILIKAGNALDVDAATANVATNQAELDALRAANVDGKDIAPQSVVTQRLSVAEALTVDGTGIVLADGVVHAQHLVQTEAVITQSAQIGNSLIDGDHIVTGAITADKLAVTDLSAVTGLFTGDITISTVSGGGSAASGIWLTPSKFEVKYDGQSKLLFDAATGTLTIDGSAQVGSGTLESLAILIKSLTGVEPVIQTEAPSWAAVGQVWIDSDPPYPAYAMSEISAGAATFARNSVAYKLNGSQVTANVPRFETGKFGQGLTLEYATTNLLTSNQQSVETDTTGFAALASATIARSTAYARHGTASLQTTTPGSATGEGFETTSTSVTASKPYTASVYVRGSGTVVLALQERDSADTLIGETVSSSLTLTDTWQRLIVSRTFGASGVKARLQVRTTSAQAVTFYTDCSQLENWTWATSWYPGTRAAEAATIPTQVLSAAEGTIEFWAMSWGARATNDPQPARVLAAGPATWDNYKGIQIFINPSPHVWRVTYGTGTGAVSLFDTQSYMPETWDYIAVTWSSAGVKLYRNGVCVASSTTPPVFEFGQCILGTPSIVGPVLYGCLNGVVDSLRISSRARTDTEIAANYTSADEPLSDSDITCLLRFDNSLLLINTGWEEYRGIRSGAGFQSDSLGHVTTIDLSQGITIRSTNTGAGVVLNSDGIFGCTDISDPDGTWTFKIDNLTGMAHLRGAVQIYLPTGPTPGDTERLSFIDASGNLFASIWVRPYDELLGSNFLNFECNSEIFAFTGEIYASYGIQSAGYVSAGTDLYVASNLYLSPMLATGFTGLTIGRVRFTYSGTDYDVLRLKSLYPVDLSWKEVYVGYWQEIDTTKNGYCVRLPRNMGIYFYNNAATAHVGGRCRLFVATSNGHDHIFYRDSTGTVHDLCG